MRGSISPLPNTLSWRGAQLKHREFTEYTELILVPHSFTVARNKTERHNHQLCCKMDELISIVCFADRHTELFTHWMAAWRLD
jgi:hypothetical protein